MEDPLAKWQREGIEAEEREAAAQRERRREETRERRQAQAQATQGWESWIAGEVDRRVAEHMEAQRSVTRDLLKLFNSHNEILEKISARFAEVKIENTALRERITRLESRMVHGPGDD